jgi:hypothetical protein
MRPDIAEIARQIQELRAAVITLKDGYADDPQQMEAAEDVELALGWALNKIVRLAKREDAVD